MKSEIVVRTNMDCSPGGMELLTPGSSLRWGRCRFDFNPGEGGRADFAVVLGMHARATALSARRRTPCLSRESRWLKSFTRELSTGSLAMWSTATQRRIIRICMSARSG